MGKELVVIKQITTLPDGTRLDDSYTYIGDKVSHTITENSVCVIHTIAIMKK